VVARSRANDEVDVKRDVMRNGTSASEIEIWKSIYYLDPDRELKRSDAGSAWVLLFVLVCALTFLAYHWAF
jgi:hypothetical protein